MNSEYFRLAARAHATEDAYNKACVALRGSRSKMTQRTLDRLAKEASQAHYALDKWRAERNLKFEYDPRLDWDLNQ